MFAGRGGIRVLWRSQPLGISTKHEGKVLSHGFPPFDLIHKCLLFLIVANLYRLKELEREATGSPPPSPTFLNAQVYYAKTILFSILFTKYLVDTY